MATKEQDQAIREYAALMTEVDLRITAINVGTMNQIPLNSYLVQEFCYLQLRMICEIVALGCRLAHGDVVKLDSKRLQSEWSAEKIFDRLGKLHPDFFPYTIKITPTAGGGGVTISPLQPQPLSKSEFLSLYGRCGDWLHRGSFKKMFVVRKPISVSYSEITKAAQSLVNLLSNHSIFLFDGTTSIHCSMRGPGGHPRVAIAESVPGQPPLTSTF
jgi:hypothetical protein